MSEQHTVRVEKLSKLREAGMEPYPASVPITTSIRSVLERYDVPADSITPNTWTGETVSIGGRVVIFRNGGNLCFAALREGDSDIQIMLEKNTLGIEKLKMWKSLADLGDRVSVTGEIGYSSTGQLSIKASDWVMASKCLQPMPSKTEGVTDPEIVRKSRHIDLLTNGPSVNLLKARTGIMRSIRQFFWSEGYDEVDTPILQKTHGGASARPFKTVSNALDIGLSLRIAPELYLKRLMVGGCERIFEIGPNFRNEGIDSRHSPEFMMLEAYAMWGDYNSMKDVVKNLILNAAKAVKTNTIELKDGSTFALNSPWRSATMHELVGEAFGVAITSDVTLEELQILAEGRGYEVQKSTSGEAVVELFEEFVEKTLLTPTFVTDWPIEVRPLTRVHRKNPALTESWDLIINGQEVGTAYSELIDPIDQRERLAAQSALAAGGDLEAMELDESFLGALEYAMAPTGGLGLGIDRLIMLLTGAESIRDTITFPMMK